MSFAENYIFNPLELNDNELFSYYADPDNYYFIQLACLTNILNCTYYNEYLFNKKYNVCEKPFSIVHMNNRSVKQNLSNFEDYIMNIELDPTIIALP